MLQTEKSGCQRKFWVIINDIPDWIPQEQLVPWLGRMLRAKIETTKFMNKPHSTLILPSMVPTEWDTRNITINIKEATGENEERGYIVKFDNVPDDLPESRLEQWLQNHLRFLLKKTRFDQKSNLFTLRPKFIRMPKTDSMQIQVRKF